MKSLQSNDQIDEFTLGTYYSSMGIYHYANSQPDLTYMYIFDSIKAATGFDNTTYAYLLGSINDGLPLKIVARIMMTAEASTASYLLTDYISYLHSEMDQLQEAPK